MEKWERHNAPNGEHIWAGDRHIADIVTDTDNPGCDANVTEIAKSAMLMHNNPRYKAVDDLHEALKGMLNVFDRGLPSSSIGRTTCDTGIKALAKADAEVANLSPHGENLAIQLAEKQTSET